MVTYGNARQRLELYVGDESPLLTLKESADYLRMSVSSFYRLMRYSNRVPPVEMNGRVLYRKEDLDKYIEEHTK